MSEALQVPAIVARAKAATTRRAIDTLSFNDAAALVQYAVFAHEMLADIHRACAAAEEQKAAVNPASICNFIITNYTTTPNPQEEAKAS